MPFCARLADTPQAKGLVERMNGTVQDRLVKALRLASINGMEAANEFVTKKLLYPCLLAGEDKRALLHVLRGHSRRTPCLSCNERSGDTAPTDNNWIKEIGLMHYAISWLMALPSNCDCNR